MLLEEIHGSIFTNNTDSLAHCVAEDMNMGRGIAVIFKEKFGNVDKLLKQSPKTGSMVYLKTNKRYIYYLVTKKRSYGKPTLRTLEESLQSLKKHALSVEIKCIAMPKIGCGLDQLDWSDVKNLINRVFEDTEINIKIYVI